MKPKLVITDIDDTIAPRRYSISPRTKKAIQCLQEHGVLFGIASGRPLEEIFPNETKWGVSFDVIIAFNGCHIWDKETNKLHEYYLMKKDWMKETFEIMKPFNVVPNIFVDGYNYFGEEMDLSGYPSEFVCKYNFDPSFYWKDNPKIMWRLKDEKDMNAIEEHIKKHPSPYYHGFKTGSMLVEFANKNVSKGFALNKICEMKNIDIQDVIALGDTSNDNELLQAAGIGVCLKNGTEDTKACADVITDLDIQHDGWADYIEKAVLIPNNWM